MSKNNAKTATKAPMSTATQKKLIITLICVITALVIAASLIIVLWETPEKVFVDKNNENLPTSTATVKNGNFEYVSDDAITYPKDAQNWNRYGYKKATSATVQGYTDIGTNANTLMGVVDTADWDSVEAGLSQYDVTVTNPGVPAGQEEPEENTNVYMINNTTATTASIYSNSLSIPSSTSVKISLNVKTVDVTGHGAFVMLKQSSVSACETSSSGVQYWYAHDGVEGNGLTTNGAWETVELYVFNRTSSSKTVYLNVGLGNVYTGATAAGQLFIDDITFDKLTANEYRQFHDDNDSKIYTINTDDEAKETSTLTVTAEGVAPMTTMSSQDYLDNTALSQGTSPFIENDINIYSISNDGTIASAIGARTENVAVDGPITNTSYLVSMWVRVIATEDLVLPSANLTMYDATTDDELASFSNVKTAYSSEIAEDTTNGWVQYHFYVKPANVNNEINVLVSFGSTTGYVNADAIPEGTLLFTQPVLEELTSEEYNLAAAGSFVSKTELNATSSSSSISNNSFGYIATNSHGDSIHYPTDWQGLFAGSAEFLKNGEDNITVDNTANAVTGGVDLDSTHAPALDDGAKGVLKIENKLATSYGFLSGDIALSAKTTYAISVLCKNENGNPNMYVINSADDTVLGLAGRDATDLVADKTFNMPTADGNWTRFYFIITTGDNAMNVNLALFNGTFEADAKEATTLGLGTVYFDQANVTELNTYTRDNDVDDLFTKNDNGEYILNTEKATENTFASATGYIEYEEMLTAWADKDNVEVLDLSATDINEPVEVEDNTDEEETTEPTDVNIGLLLSIITSGLLVAALLIVLVVKFVGKKKHTTNN